MARGSESKQKITNEILNTFKGSFVYNKEIRVPIEENGEIIQIKITLTAAKQNVEMGSDTAIPGDAPAPAMATSSAVQINETATEPSAKEKEHLAHLMEMVNEF